MHEEDNCTITSGLKKTKCRSPLTRQPNESQRERKRNKTRSRGGKREKGEEITRNLTTLKMPLKENISIEQPLQKWLGSFLLRPLSALSYSPIPSTPTPRDRSGMFLFLVCCRCGKRNDGGWARVVENEGCRRTAREFQEGGTWREIPSTL